MDGIKTKGKMRLSIFFLGLFMASMLFQTGSNSLGTLVAFAMIAMIFFFYFIENGPVFRMGSIGGLMLLFLLVSTAITLMRSELPSYYVKLVAQILVFIIILGIPKANAMEEAYLRNIFVLSSVFYALVAIAEKIASSATETHADMVLFGTGIDPNFFGIPIVASATILLYQLCFFKKNRPLYALGYFILIVAILYSSSRGSFLSLIVGNALVLISFIRSRQMTVSRKVIISLLLVAAVFFLYQYVQGNFSDAWDRMTSISEEGSDNGRLILWKRAIKTWLSYPVFGGGLFCNFITYHGATHNTYIQVLSETGLFGMGIYLFMMFSMFKRAIQHNKIYCFMLVPMMLQIAFLDALDNRCVWSIFCWLAALPSSPTEARGANRSQQVGKLDTANP